MNSNANKKINSKKRLRGLFYAVLVLFAVIILRMVQLMFIEAGMLQDQVENQWTSETTIVAQRGDILDANGQVLATSASVKSVLLKPQDIKDPGEVASLLSEILEMDEQTIFDKASDKSKMEVWLKRQITSEQAGKN